MHAETRTFPFSIAKKLSRFNIQLKYFLLIQTFLNLIIT